MIKHPLYPALSCNIVLRYFVTSPIPDIPYDLCIGVEASPLFSYGHIHLKKVLKPKIFLVGGALGGATVWEV